VRPVRIISTGHHLLGVTAGWQLLARGPNDLLRIQLAEGRITWTYVPSLTTGSPDVAFLPAAHETIIRPADFVPGYVVPDGGPAQLLPGPLADGGRIIPGPRGTETAWISTDPLTSYKLSLVTLSGHLAGPVIKLPAGGPQLPATAVSDGRGDVLVADSSFTSYDAGPTWDRPLPGAIIAVGPASWLTVICDAHAQHCRNVVIDSDSGARRVLPGATRPAPYFFTWPPAGVISPDGRTAAVVGRVVAGRGDGPTNAVHLVNLRTGVTKDLGLRLGGTDGFPLRTITAPQTLVWSPDSRWLFVVATVGNLVAIDARTDRAESLGITLPQIQQVAIRS